MVLIPSVNSEFSLALCIRLKTPRKDRAGRSSGYIVRDTAMFQIADLINKGGRGSVWVLPAVMVGRLRLGRRTVRVVDHT